MKIQLTTKGIEKLIADQAALTRRVDYFDQSHPGLCLTVGPTSASWFRFMRVAGKLTRIKLGDYPSLSLSEARKAHGSEVVGGHAGSVALAAGPLPGGLLTPGDRLRLAAGPVVAAAPSGSRPLARSTRRRTASRSRSTPAGRCSP